jgi:hypothetical protein
MHVAQDVATINALAFINRDPTVMSIIPRHTIVTGSGGKKWVDDDPVPDEVVRTIPSTTTGEKQPVRITPDGRTVMPSWMIMTAPVTNITIGSILTDGDGNRYEVVYRARVPSWRTVFEAIENG